MQVNRCKLRIHIIIENFEINRKTIQICLSVYTVQCKFILKMTSKAKLIAKMAVINELKKLKTECQNKKKKAAKRKYWVKPLLIKRCDFDIEAHLLKDLLWKNDDSDFNNFCRLNIHQFEEMFSLVHTKLTKSDTPMREAISPRTKLAITLRYIATGDSFRSLEFLSRVSRSAMSRFVPIALRAIYDALQSTYLKIPDTEEEWNEIAEDFNKKWQLPHTLGALDGKHIRIKAPPNSGSQFYNYKGFFSIVLFASVDAHCRFSFIDVGCNGKASDSTIYQDGFLYNALENGSLNIPKSNILVSGQDKEIPYFFIGDDAFRLDKHLMKPFSRTLKLNIYQEIFNYRLCRARMVVECAFGRLAKRFAIFNRPIEVDPSTVDLVVMVCCLLHNYLTPKRNAPVGADLEIETLPETFSPIGLQDNKSYKYASRIRDDISRYLVTDGNVDFQWKKINISNK